MRYRLLGRSGLTVSEIGFGGWGIGGQTAGQTSYGATDDNVSQAALVAALAAGITFFDTAPAYGDGHSERLIGAAVCDQRDQVVLATKAGMSKFGEPPDFAPAAIRGSLVGSLERLGCDYVDLLQLHNPTPALLQSTPAIAEELRALKSAGLIRAFGFSMASPLDGIAAIDAVPDVACLQINLNMLDLRAEECGLIGHCDARGIGLIARTPMGFGFLSGDPAAAGPFAAADHRSRFDAAQIDRWRVGAEAAFAAVPVPPGKTRGQVALRFCLSWPTVACAIPGILTPTEARENAAASDLDRLSSQQLDDIRALNRRQSFKDAAQRH